MSTKYPGGLITKTPVTPAGPYQTGAAPGVWTLEQVLQYNKQGIWPTAGLTPNYIEDVFSTYLYAGSPSNKTIVNGINLSGNGGLVWMKSLTDYTATGYDHALYDTARGNLSRLSSSTTSAAATGSGSTYMSSFNSDGFTLVGNGFLENYSPNMVSWTFRKQPKFFDIVTYTGTGSARTIAHSLASTPGCIMVKRTDTTANWQVYHVGFAVPIVSAQLNLFATPAAASTVWNSTAPTSSVFSVGTSTDVNASGGTYVAYLFANNAGGFGLTGTDNVITCGMVTGAGSTTYVPVSLGYEPQWILTKKNGSSGGWSLFDVMRGWTTTINLNASLLANTADATDPGQWQPGSPSATGINFLGLSGEEYSYIAIRRGPMKTPTTGTSVFAPVTVTGNDTDNRQVSSGFVTDFVIGNRRTGAVGANGAFVDRLRGPTPILYSYATDAEATGNVGVRSFAVQDGMTVGGNTAYSFNYSGQTYVNWMFQRAPGFFDEICYTTPGSISSPVTQNHNLGVSPELIIIKPRTGAGRNWFVISSSGLTTGQYMYLDNVYGATNYSGGGTSTWSATSTTITIPTGYFYTSSNYVTYLFATLAGVSKVGSYTGTGATQTISCGFTGGARFVLVKRTDSTGDWYVWDTARGMVSGTDPSLLLNSLATEVNANSIYTATGGFQIVSTAAGINASGGTYIYLAIS